MVKMEEKDLRTLLDTIGVDNEVLYSDQNVMALMNFALQCLGGIRMITVRQEGMKKADILNSGITEDIKKVSNARTALRNVFGTAVNRMMANINQLTELDDLDPSKHLVESFPNTRSMLEKRWLPLQWGAVGNIGLVNNREIDLRISNLNNIAMVFPETINELDREGRSFLHYCCRLESVKLIDRALRITKPPILLTFPNSNGAFPVHNASRYSKSESVVSYLINAMPEIIRQGNFENTLPLHWAAAKSRNVKIIEALLSAYPDGIEKPNNEGYLPLHCACQNSCLDVVKAVHEAYLGAINSMDHEGGLPFHHACFFNHSVEVVKYIYQAFPEAISIAQSVDRVTALHLAASQNGSVEVIKFILLQDPSSIYAEDSEGWLPLHCLVNIPVLSMTTSRIDCLRQLVRSYPQSVSSKNRYGQTPYQKALQLGHCRLVLRILLSACPEMDIVRYRDMNWEARKISILTFYRLRQQYVYLTVEDRHSLIQEPIDDEIHTNSIVNKRLKDNDGDCDNCDNLEDDKDSEEERWNQSRKKAIIRLLRLFGSTGGIDCFIIRNVVKFL